MQSLFKQKSIHQKCLPGSWISLCSGIHLFHTDGPTIIQPTSMITAKFTVLKFPLTENFVAPFVFDWNLVHPPEALGFKQSWFSLSFTHIITYQFLLIFLNIIIIAKTCLQRIYIYNNFVFKYFCYYHMFLLNDLKKYSLRKIVISFWVLILIAHKDIQVSWLLKNMLKEWLG